MKLGLKYYIKDIESRIKRIEEKITSPSSVLVNILNIDEKIGMSDTITIHSRVPNDTFFIGYSKLGTDYIGDVRSAPVLVYSG